MAHERAGQVAQASDLIDVDKVLAAYDEIVPDPTNPDQMVVFGTSGHRGSSLDGAFNDAHIAATTQAIIEYRASQGTTGPLYIAKDTHALSLPAWKTAIEVLTAHGVHVRAEREDEYTPTPVAVTGGHRPQPQPRWPCRPTASSSPRRTTRPVTAASSTTRRTVGRPTPMRPRSSPPAPTSCWRIPSQVRRTPYEQCDVERWDYRSAYCLDLTNAIDLDAIRNGGRTDRRRSHGWRVGAVLGVHRREPRPRPHGRQPDGRPDVALHDARPRRQDPHGLLVAVRDGVAGAAA